MRILGSIVAPSTTLMSSCDSKITGSGSIRPQIVRDQLVWDKSILLQQLAHEFQRGTLVPPALDQHIKHFALGIHGAPKIDHAAGDFQIDLASHAEESHLRVLPEPCVNLSIHTAPDVRPLPTSRLEISNGLALSTGLLPLPVGPGAWLNNAIPSVQSHYRTFIPTTNCSAPVPASVL